jgi:hypothetical protein
MARKIIEGKHLGELKMLPAKEGTCGECATEHLEHEPHNQQSMFYQYHFYNNHGRWPTWADAMEHCERGIKDHWIKELKKHGIEVVEESKGE